MKHARADREANTAGVPKPVQKIHRQQNLKDASEQGSPSEKQAVLATAKTDEWSSRLAVPAAKSVKKYGIEDAIALMRKLPEADMRLVATVIKESLDSAAIKLDQILSDAEEKETRLESQIRKLDAEIEELEMMIKQRRDSIIRLADDLRETREVKNNLSMANREHEIS